MIIRKCEFCLKDIPHNKGEGLPRYLKKTTCSRECARILLRNKHKGFYENREFIFN